MQALSNKLQKQNEDLDRKLAADNRTSLAFVVKNMNKKQTKPLVKNDNNLQKATKRSTTSNNPTEMESDDESTESDNSCKYYHNDLCGSYKEENDSGYFKKGYDMYGSSCSQCKLFFKPIDDGKCYVVSRKRSVFVCLGRNKYQCKHALCKECYNKKIERIGGRLKRKRKSISNNKNNE